jgi:hypothetical protein
MPEAGFQGILNAKTRSRTRELTVIFPTPLTSALHIVGTLHFALLRHLPVREPLVLLVIGATLVGLASTVRGRVTQ